MKHQAAHGECCESHASCGDGHGKGHGHGHATGGRHDHGKGHGHGHAHDKGHGHAHSRGPGQGHGWRKYASPEEEREFIEQYIPELEQEIAGARARLDQLK